MKLKTKIKCGFVSDYCNEKYDIKREVSHVWTELCPNLRAEVRHKSLLVFTFWLTLLEPCINKNWNQISVTLTNKTQWIVFMTKHWRISRNDRKSRRQMKNKCFLKSNLEILSASVCKYSEWEIQHQHYPLFLLPQKILS